MFETPSDETIVRIVIDANVVNKTAEPYVERSNAKKQKKKFEFNSSKVIDAEEVS